MQAHRRPVRERPALAREQPQRRVDALGRRVQRRIEHDVAARDRVPRDAVADEVERAALAGDAALRGRVLRVDRAHARAQAARG